MRSPKGHELVNFSCQKKDKVAYPKKEQNGDETKRIYGLAQREFRSPCPLVIATTQCGSFEESHGASIKTIQLPISNW